MVLPEKKPGGLDASEKPTFGKGVFRNCESCNETLQATVFYENFEVCPQCDHHHKIGTDRWIELLTDSFEPLFENLISNDPLGFEDGKPYPDRLHKAMVSSGKNEAICIGKAAIGPISVAFGTFAFEFMGGSMGSVVGEKITLLFEYATENKLPVVLCSASGGARMQEGILSLMQMAKTVAARELFAKAHMPFISVLRHPTTGGVAASFAFLGDINLAEQGALIGFAGPRVIETTIRQVLPEGFQRAAFLHSHGMVDRVVSRLRMKKEIIDLLTLLCPETT